MSARTKRVVVASIVILLGVLGGGGWWVWRLMGAPLYQPGMVRSGVGLRGPLQPPLQPDDPHRWRVDGDIDLYHFSHGSGRPILFVHGGPGFPTRGVPNGLQQLGAEFEVHFYDQRGCGRSTRPFDRLTLNNFYQAVLLLDQTLGLSAQIADIERIRRILGEERLILMGHSFGAFLAGLYAAEFPERVQALVLIAPADLFVFPSRDFDVFDAVRERLPDDLRAPYAKAVNEHLGFANLGERDENSLAAANREFGRYFLLAEGGEERDRLAALDEAANGGWMVKAMYLSMGRRHDYSAALRGVTAPVLVIHGDRDLQPESVSRVCAGRFADARIEVVRHAGHFVFDDRPAEFTEAVRKFLETVESN